MTLNYNLKLWSLSQGQVAFFLSSVVSLLTLKTLTPYPEHTPWSPRAPFLRVPLQRLQAGGSSGRGGRDAGERGAECLAGGGGSHAPPLAPSAGQLGSLPRRQRPGLGGPRLGRLKRALQETLRPSRRPQMALETMRLPWGRNAESGARSVGACSHGDAGYFRTPRISRGAGPAHPRLSGPRKHEARELRLGSKFLSAATESSTILFFKGILPLRKDAGSGGKST